jgi:hypothetical protein
MTFNYGDTASISLGLENSWNALLPAWFKKSCKNVNCVFEDVQTFYLAQANGVWYFNVSLYSGKNFKIILQNAQETRKNDMISRSKLDSMVSHWKEYSYARDMFFWRRITEIQNDLESSLENLKKAKEHAKELTKYWEARCAKLENYLKKFYAEKKKN